MFYGVCTMKVDTLNVQYSCKKHLHFNHIYSGTFFSLEIPEGLAKENKYGKFANINSFTNYEKILLKDMRLILMIV